VPSTPAAHLPLTERLRPRRLDDLVGNPRARYELRAWATQWQEGRTPARRAAVLSGPAGVGKTTAALALAAEFGWTLVEMNASDSRNETAVEQVAGRASVSHTLGETVGARGPRHALILLDEADCLTGRLTETARPRATPPVLSEFLRGRYGSIEALNVAWGLAPGGKPKPFDDWSKVPRSPGNAGWARLRAARRDLDDWRASGRSIDLSDHGGLGAITRLVRSTHQPIVLTVNDDRTLTRYSTVFRTGVVRVRFYPVRDDELSGFVQRVAQTEHIALHPGALEAIVKRAHGDVRASLNDLDAIAPLAPGPWQLSVLGYRDQTADFVALTEEALSSPRYYRSVEIQDRLDATPDDLIPWIEENLPAFAPDAAHRDAAFRALAVAEQFLNRARRARVYGLWSYASEVMTGGVSLALHDATGSAPRGGVSFPQFLGEMGRSRSFRALRDAIASKTGHRFHLSRAKARETVLPFLEGMFGVAARKDAPPTLRQTAVRTSRELELTPEEVAFLLGAPPDSRIVAEFLKVGGGDEPPLADDDEEAESVSAGSSDDSMDPRKPLQRQLSDFGS
jgi:DNA polymerase III delta prime subunit